jgi:hypothetical protein
MSNNSLQFTRPLSIVMIIVSGFCITGKNWLIKKGIDYEVVVIGNLILYIVSMAAYLISSRAMRSSNPQAFVRAMYLSFMVKFFVVVITAFIYIMMTRKNVNKPALGICAVLYIIYTVIETKALTRLLKQKKNA